MSIQRVCFVGAGTMGSINSLVCSLAGYQTVLYDLSEEALRRAPLGQKLIGAQLVADGVHGQSAIDAAIERIERISDPARAAADVDLLSESVHEQLDLKRKVHAQFDELCPAKTIMTTNTSSLLVSEIEIGVKRLERFAAMHFHGLGSLVDIVRGTRTRAETVEALVGYVRSIGQVPVVIRKDSPGYLHNAMLISLLRTAILLVADGVGDPEDVDRCWMLVQRTPVGPFGQLDWIGINVGLDVAEQEYERTGSEDALRMAQFLRPYIDRGELGVKTGKGFYSYPNPTWQQPGFLTGENG